MGRQSQLAGSQDGHMVHHRHVGGQADRLRWDGQQQVDHRRIAGNRQFEHLRRDGADLLAGGLQQAIDRFDDQALHLGQVGGCAGVAGIDDARDHVLAPGNLAVVVACLGQHLARGQIHQPYGNGRRADVDRRAQVAFGLIARQYGQELWRAVGLVPRVRRQDHGYVPGNGGFLPHEVHPRVGLFTVTRGGVARTRTPRVLPAKDLTQALKHKEAHPRRRHTQAGQLPGHSRPVVGLVCQVRRLQVQRITLDRLVEAGIIVKRHLDTRCRFLRHQPALDCFLRRNRYPGITFEHRLAGKSIPRRHVVGR